MTRSKPDRPSIRQAHKDLTRSSIAKAARACFYEKGVGETSFEDIAVAAGVRRATVYLHFANKNAILAELLSENLDAVTRIYGKLAALPSPDHAQVHAWLDGYVRALSGHRQALRLFLVAAAVDDQVQVLIESYRKTVVALLAERFAAFRPTSGRAYAVALLMVVKIDFVAGAVVQPGSSLDAAATLELVTEELVALIESSHIV